MIKFRTAVAMVGVMAIAAPLAARTPAPAPAALTGDVIERFIVCYPRIDAVRGQYRDEVARLERQHKAELDRLQSALADKRPPGQPPPFNDQAYRDLDSRRYALVRQPARARVFLPVALGCGFNSLDAYAEALNAIIHHFPEKPDWLRPYLDRIAPKRLPNLE
jgi:hypothetical protein